MRTMINEGIEDKDGSDAKDVSEGIEDKDGSDAKDVSEDTDVSDVTDKVNDPKTKTKLQKIWHWAKENPIKFLTAMYVMSSSFRDVYRETPRLIQDMRFIRNINIEASWDDILNDSRKLDTLVNVVQNDICRGNDIDQTASDEIMSRISEKEIVDTLKKLPVAFNDYHGNIHMLFNKLKLTDLIKAHEKTSQTRDEILRKGLVEWVHELSTKTAPESRRSIYASIKHPLHRYLARGPIGMIADKLYRMNKINTKHRIVKPR
jgi:hypothetical protein